MDANRQACGELGIDFEEPERPRSVPNETDRGDSLPLEFLEQPSLGNCDVNLISHGERTLALVHVP